LSWRLGTSELRYAVRTLARRPGLTLVAAGSLALIIGTCTAQLSYLERLLASFLPGIPTGPEPLTLSAAAVVALAYEGSAPSLFAGSYELTQGGFFQAVISATQHSTGNLGTAMVTFYVESSS
jgi:hypothetical protein